MQGWQKQYFFKPQPVVEHRVIVVWLRATKAFSYHMFLICFEAPRIPSRDDGKTCGAVLLSLLGFHCSGLKIEPCGSLGSTWKPHVTCTTFQFPKDKKALSTTIERLIGREVLSSSWSPQGLTEHCQNWHRKAHPSCKTAKKKLNCVHLVPLQELFLSGRFGNLPKQGQSLGCSSQACAQSHYTTPASSQSHLCTWCFVCICWSLASMIFSSTTFHSLTAKARSARLWWHTGCSFCWVHHRLHVPRGASHVPSLHS